MTAAVKQYFCQKEIYMYAIHSISGTKVWSVNVEEDEINGWTTTQQWAIVSISNAKIKEKETWNGEKKNKHKHTHHHSQIANRINLWEFIFISDWLSTFTMINRVLFALLLAVRIQWCTTFAYKQKKKKTKI